MSFRNFFIFDTETTGLLPKLPEGGCEIIQFSARALNGWDLSPHHAGIFNIWIKPLRPDLAEPGAIQKVGEANFKRAIEEGIEPKVAFAKIYEWILSVNDSKKDWEKPYACGHNIINFDIPALKHWLLQYKFLKSPWSDDTPWFCPIDTMVSSILLFESDPNIRSFALNPMLEILNLKRKSEIHEAEEDVELNEQLFIRQLKFLRNCKTKMRIKSTNDDKSHL